MKRKGYIQVYTGTGKGKTTAALGLALRAAGAGHRVFIAHFVKRTQTSEHKALGRFSDLVTFRQYGTGFLRGKGKTDKAAEAAQQGFGEARDIIASGLYDVVILDEINVAVHYGLISAEDVLEVLDAKPPGVEVILTGRNADQRIIARADLVTEMREIKHYYHEGVKARRGIEH
ncbi:MAG TPA: cob(I)yrinic acid a,c-diamide adenosyltransferase [Dissulfurispiraceae bacterium]|nr:cob(I)yrinic acid a,c-diamide adenosyltransferase [Dissulfurispiraceae bacterium]